MAIDEQELEPVPIDEVPSLPFPVQWGEWGTTSLEGIDTTSATEITPRFNVGEVAKVFFGRTAYWMRSQEQHIKYRPRRTETTHRVFYLEDIEEIAKELYVKARITEERFVLAMTIVRLIARVNDYPVAVYGTICPLCDEEMEFGDYLYLSQRKKNLAGEWVHQECAERIHQEQQQEFQEERMAALDKLARGKKAS